MERERADEVYPSFYLEMDDAYSSKPVLSCIGEKWVTVPDYDDVILKSDALIAKPFQMSNPAPAKNDWIIDGFFRSRLTARLSSAER